MQFAAFVLTFATLVFSCSASEYRPLLNHEAANADDSPSTDFYYQVDIQSNGKHICSGALLGKFDVLTAAQCVQGLSLEKLTLVVGSQVHNRSLQIRKVSSMSIHPLFDDFFLEFDVAILKASKPFEFGRYVDKVSLPEDGDELHAGDTATVSGRTLQMGDDFTHVKTARVTVLSREECSQRYPGTIEIGESMICAESSSNPETPAGCIADPGAPLVANGKLYGIASWGHACDPGAPDCIVYADVSRISKYFLKRNKFIHEVAASELCTALQFIAAALPSIPGIPTWLKIAVTAAMNLLLEIFC